jgi:GxxExxY protein
MSQLLDSAVARQIRENEVATCVIGAAIEVQKHFGPGLLESAYELALCHELALRRMSCERQKSLAAKYKGFAVPDAFRVDLIVEKCVIVEIKAIERTLPVHEAQLLTYLRLTALKLGLLLNFHCVPLKKGIKRIVHHL